jgi:hypothetical protein
LKSSNWPIILTIPSEPAMISLLATVLLSTSIRHIALSMLSGQYSAVCASSLLVVPDSTASATESLSPDQAAHYLASPFTSSADRRRSWMLSTRCDIRFDKPTLCLSQISLISPIVTPRNACHGTKIARCYTAARDFEQDKPEIFPKARIVTNSTPTIK